MIALVVCIICALASLAVALFLQFRLPGWKMLAGLSHMDTLRLGRMDIQPLSRRLSLVFWFIATSFSTSAVMLYIKTAVWEEILPYQFLALLLAFNAFWISFRRCDHNEYSEGIRKISRGIWLSLNVFFLVPLLLLFI